MRVLWRAFVTGVVGLSLAGCGVPRPGPDELDAGRTATARPATETADLPPPTELEQQRYVNERYGFAFLYPNTWELTEGQNFVSLSQGTVKNPAASCGASS